MYGKLVNGELRGAPRPIRTENGDVFTNDPALLLQYGYKPIITAVYPSDGGYYTESWTETESEIKQIWTAAEPPEDISADEALDIITGGADIDEDAGKTLSRDDNKSRREADERRSSYKYQPI